MKECVLALDANCRGSNGGECLPTTVRYYCTAKRCGFIANIMRIMRSDRNCYNCGVVRRYFRSLLERTECYGSLVKYCGNHCGAHAILFSVHLHKCTAGQAESNCVSTMLRCSCGCHSLPLSRKPTKRTYAGLTHIQPLCNDTSARTSNHDGGFSPHACSGSQKSYTW